MKMVKSLLLGSAAGLVAVAGAQAADLPVKAKPVEYVKVCSLYGAGFWYVPGTDTCLKVGSYVRVQTEFDANGGGPAFVREMIARIGHGAENQRTKGDRVQDSGQVQNVKIMRLRHGKQHQAVQQ